MKSNDSYWKEFLRRYRVSKTLREIRTKKNLRLRDLSSITGYSKQYINNVQEILIKPNEDFIQKLWKLENENSNT
jgi:transcriptional regulator with XRE-family HTH domain